MSTELVRVGVIGAGRLSGRRVLPSIRFAPIELVAICDVDESLARDRARTFGASRVYSDYRELLHDDGIDAVVIVVGPEQHETMGIEALQAGKHLYTEKPPAATSAGARAVLAASRASGRIAMTGFKKRFAPVYRSARRAIESQEFGPATLLTVDAACGPDIYQNAPGVPRDSFLLDSGIHMIDLSRFMLGDPSEVFAMKKSEEAYAITARFDHGALGMIGLSSNRSNVVSTEKIELTGRARQFLSIDDSVRLMRFADDGVAEFHDPNFSVSPGDSMVEQGFVGEMVEFASAVLEQREPESSIESAVGTMEFYEAIVRSVESGAPVTM